MKPMDALVSRTLGHLAQIAKFKVMGEGAVMM
jgi:hypothetical protein